MCAAISAARHGLKVALVQDRRVLGGNNSSEIRVPIEGKGNFEPYPRIGDVVNELMPKNSEYWGLQNTGEIYEDSRRVDALRAEKNISLILGHRVISVEKKKGRIRGIIAQDVRSGKRVFIQGRLFADCTGDGGVGALAGADFEVTKKGHMGPSNFWNIVDTGAPSPFPRCPWALDLTDKPFPGRAKYAGQWAQPGLESLGQWFWECGFDWDPINEIERMRDWNLRAMYGAWDALKNVDGMYPTYKLNWAAHITGKRESRRLLGDLILGHDDVVSGSAFDDACFPCTWSLDLHLPHPVFSPGFKGHEFIAEASIEEFKKPFWAPYRCLYSRNIPNLFMAGRDISVTHEALGTVRVMGTCGMMGEVVGMAASLCAKHDAAPREVYGKHLPELIELLKRGVPSR